MNTREMLNRMCQGQLTGPDIKAICTARGFPVEAESSPGILETLFLCPQGLGDVFAELSSNEIALLHLLKQTPSVVSVSLLSRVYAGAPSHGTFNQRFQDVFANVKQRLVRKGLLLWDEARQVAGNNTSKMERYRFALPAEFHPHLPRLIPSPRRFDGDGDWRRRVVADQLTADLGRSGKKADPGAVFQIEAGELRMNGRTFTAESVTEWQHASWKRALEDDQKKKPGAGDLRLMQPDAAVRCILSDLREGEWVDPEQLTDAFRVFSGRREGVETACEAGWQWGLLAKRSADGKTWYRPAPKTPAVAPRDYLRADRNGRVLVDVTAAPFDALEQIVAISDQHHSIKASLLVTPSFVKLGRADDQLLAAEPIAWLVEHTPSFADVFAQLGERRGKTVLHENVAIARVTDLSLKVAMERALRGHVVSLKEDFIAFPCGLLDDARRVVKRSGHVVKEHPVK